jgi:hypothetical protein
MDKVEDWLEKKGYSLSVEPDAKDEVHFEPTLCVFINSNQSRESKLHTALHECGHILIRKSRMRCGHKGRKRCTGISAVEEQKGIGRYKKSTTRRRMAVMTEEIEAWERGLTLARRLCIKVNKKRFENARIRALMTYCRWCCKK